MAGVYFSSGLLSLHQQQQQQQQGVHVMRQHQEGEHLVGEEALHSDAEPGSSARQRLPQHEAHLLRGW